MQREMGQVQWRLKVGRRGPELEGKSCFRGCIERDLEGGDWLAAEERAPNQRRIPKVLPWETGWMSCIFWCREQNRMRSGLSV